MTNAIDTRTENQRYRCQTIDWNGFAVEVRYCPDWSRIGAETLAHLEIVSPDRAALPVTATGYRSHFCMALSVEDAGGPAAYARMMLDEAARSAEWIERELAARQLALF